MGNLKFLKEVNIDPNFDTSVIFNTDWDSYKNESIVRTHKKKLSHILEEYGGLPESYNTQNTLIYQRFFTEEEINFKELGDSLNMEVFTVSAIQQRPGNTIPLHIDRFFKLRQKANDTSKQPVRANIFLEDWKMGHILQFENDVISKWKKHTGFMFNDEVLHLSSNCGMENKYTLQISGFLKDAN